MKITQEEQEQLNSLIVNVRMAWSNLHNQLPHVLYHYTSADGLIGILSSKSIWLTDLRYMNDLSELQYSRELVEKRLSVALSIPTLTEVQKQFLERISSSFNPFHLGHSVFSASFCEEGNLLSQWRAYRGRGGGYAIGFDFFHLLRLLSRPCVLRKIIYDQSKQLELIDSVIENFLAFLQKEGDARSDDFLPAVCQMFSVTIGELMFGFKHPDFREELEWRLVHFAYPSPTSNRDSEIPRFRSYDGNIIPYYCVDFDKAIAASRDDTLGYAFPIVQVMIGPTINADLNQESAKMLLLSLNPDIVPNISRSGIPLRWL